MPTKRGNGRYYLQRKVPGIGDVYRSLSTDRKGLARKREDMLLALAEQGHQDVVRAWLEGDVSLAEIQEAYDTSRVHELTTRIRRGDAAVTEACRAALLDKAPDVAGSTLSGYETALTRFQTHCNAEGVSGVRDALTTDVVQRFKGWCLDELDVARETVNNYLTGVSVLVTYAERRGWLDDRPEIKKFESTVRISYLEASELAAYFAELRPRFRPLMRLLVGTGMRLGEAEALTPSDLRLGNGEARAAIKDAKTPSGVRTVFLPASAAETLQAHIRRHDREHGESIFTVPRRTVQKEHNRARKRIGRPSYTIHDHRHTAAVHLARAGMPLHLLQQQLGHANIDQTMRYARFHPDYGDVSEYFDRVAEGLGLGHSMGHTPAEETEEEVQGARA